MRLKAVNMERCIGCYTCMFACSRYRFGSISITRSAIHVRTHGGLEGPFIVIVCHACKDPPCVKACNVGALSKRPRGGSVLNADLCNGCGRCVKACIIGSLTMDEETGKPIVCTYCGICAKYCPHKVLELRE